MWCGPRRTSAALRELAPRYGFGFVDGWHKVGRRFWPGDQAGAYLSSYFIGGRGRRRASPITSWRVICPALVVFVGRDLRVDRVHDAKSPCLAAALGVARGPDPAPAFEYEQWLAAAAMLQPRKATPRGP